jgi:phosphoglycerol geranylgeranyltransferase
MIGPVFRRLLDLRTESPRLLWLVDPDKVQPRRPDPRWAMAEDCGVAALLVGTSQGENPDLDCAIASIRKSASVPLILFPGSASQLSPHVDAILFLTLLSGRNPDFLVGEQVKGAPLVRDFRIEPIPTGYVLVDTGSTTSVAKHSGTAPIPESDVTSICDHALCAQYMGQSLVYLEAGSGAAAPIGKRVIELVRGMIDIPLIVGGGLTTAETCQAAVQAGADFVVVGTALETDRSEGLLRELSDAVRGISAAIKQ